MSLTLSSGCKCSCGCSGCCCDGCGTCCHSSCPPGSSRYPFAMDRYRQSIERDLLWSMSEVKKEALSGGKREALGERQEALGGGKLKALGERQEALSGGK